MIRRSGPHGAGSTHLLLRALHPAQRRCHERLALRTSRRIRPHLLHRHLRGRRVLLSHHPQPGRLLRRPHLPVRGRSPDRSAPPAAATAAGPVLARQHHQPVALRAAGHGQLGHGELHVPAGHLPHLRAVGAAATVPTALFLAQRRAGVREEDEVCQSGHAHTRHGEAIRAGEVFRGAEPRDSPAGVRGPHHRAKGRSSHMRGR